MASEYSSAPYGELQPELSFSPPPYETGRDLSLQRTEGDADLTLEATYHWRGDAAAVEAALQEAMAGTDGSYVIEETAAGLLPIEELPLPEIVGQLPEEWQPLNERALQR